MGHENPTIRSLKDVTAHGSGVGVTEDGDVTRTELQGVEHGQPLFDQAPARLHVDEYRMLTLRGQHPQVLSESSRHQVLYSGLLYVLGVITHLFTRNPHLPC